MQEFEEVVVSNVSKNLKRITCEICKKQSTSTNWGNGYEIRNTTVECSDGVYYPGDSEGTNYSIDMCPDCFIEKLIPWVEAQGGQVTRVEF